MLEEEEEGEGEEEEGEAPGEGGGLIMEGMWERKRKRRKRESRTKTSRGPTLGTKLCLETIITTFSTKNHRFFTNQKKKNPNEKKKKGKEKEKEKGKLVTTKQPTKQKLCSRHLPSSPPQSPSQPLPTPDVAMIIALNTFYWGVETKQ